MHSNHTATARAGNAVYLKPSFPTERHQLLQTAKFHLTVFSIDFFKFAKLKQIDDLAVANVQF